MYYLEKFTKTENKVEDWFIFHMQYSKLIICPFYRQHKYK